MGFENDPESQGSEDAIWGIARVAEHRLEIEDLLATPGCAHEVSPGDKVVALIRLNPTGIYIAENDAAVVPKNSRAYKPWVKAIKRNVAKASP